MLMMMTVLYAICKSVFIIELLHNLMVLAVIVLAEEMLVVYS